MKPGPSREERGDRPRRFSGKGGDKPRRSLPPAHAFEFPRRFRDGPVAPYGSRPVLPAQTPNAYTPAAQVKVRADAQFGR